MDKKDRFAKSLFKRYLQKKTTPAETQSVEQWYDSFDQNQIPATAPVAENIKTEIWSKVSARITPVKPIRTHAVRKIWVAAAILLILAGASFYYFYQDTAATLYPENKWSLLSTRPGEKRQFLLADSSTLILNGGSTVYVSKDMSQTRKIALVDGESFFDIHHDASRPFIVQTGEITTMVLGTAFNIRYFRDISQFNINVVRGKVSVKGKETAENILTQNQSLAVNIQTGLHRKQLLTEPVADWQKGIIQLDNSSFEETCIIIKKSFNITMEAADKEVEKSHYSAQLPADITPQKAMEILAAIHHFKVERSNDSTFILQHQTP